MPSRSPGKKLQALPLWLLHVLGAVLVSVLIVALTALALWQESERYRERAEVSTRNLSILLSSEVNQLIVRTDTLIQSAVFYYGDSVSRGKIDKARFNDYMEKKLSLVPEVLNLRVIDKDGILRYGTGELAPVSFADRAYFRHARDNPSAGLIFEGPLFTRLTRKWALLMTRRLNNPDGSFAGIVIANVVTDNLEKQFSRLDLGEQGLVVLRGADLAQIARYPAAPGADGGIGNRIVSEQLRQMLGKNPVSGSYVAISRQDNIARIYGYHKVGDYPFYIVTGRAHGEFFANWQRNAGLMLGLSALMLLVTCLGSWWIYRLSLQAARQRNEQRAAQILEASPLPMMLVDPQGRVRNFNAAATSLLGYARHELQGAAIETLIPQRYREGHPACREAFMQNGTLQPMLEGRDALALHRKGREIPVRIQLAAVGLEDGRHCIVVLEDQTERKRAEKEQHELLVRLRLATEAAQTGIWNWDFASGRHQWDEQTCRLFGVPTSHCKTGVSYALWRSCLHPQDLDAVEHALQKARSSCSSFEEVFRIVLPDGRIRHLHAAGAMRFDEAGQPVGMVGVNRDITAQQELEARLLAAKEAAEAANAAKSHFVANMSHEIRTPMSAIIGMTYLALKTDEPGQKRDYLLKIQSSSQHLLGILNDVLDFSRIDAGKLSLECVDFELEMILIDMSAVVAEAAAAKGLELHVSIDDGVPHHLVGDPLRIGQILINYASNAVKFTESGGIDVKVSVAERSADDVLLHFSVRDTGIGLNEAQRAALFQSFQQADASITRKYGGTGLGLVISKRLAELMHGEVGVESMPGVGSTFWFTARLGISQGPAQIRTLSAQPDLSRIAGARVLLVEDSELIREVVSKLLQEAGLEVELAANGASALEKVRHASYDLVLMDMQMPVMDGLTATREIRKLPSLEVLPIVAITANVMTGDRERCLAAGMNDHLAKPIDRQLLLASLQRWIRPRAAGSLIQPVAAESAPRRALAGISGLDAAEGLRLVGSEAVYHDMLGKFVSGRADMAAHIALAIAESDWEKAERIAHMLRGTAAQIGAGELRAIAEQLENAIRNREPAGRLAVLQADIASALSALVEAIGAKLPAADQTAGNDVQPGQ